MKRPSVLFINRLYPPARGATGRVLRDLAKVFAKEGWHVTVLTTGEKEKIERDGGVHVVRVKAPENPTGGLGYLLVWAKLYMKAMRMPRRHLLVTMTDPPLLAYAGMRIAKAKKCRHIHWCQDLYPDLLPAIGVSFPGFLMKLMKRMSYKALQSSDKVITIGRCMARHLSYNGVDPKKITVIPNWPNPELGKPVANNSFNSKSGHERAHMLEGARNCAKPYDDLIKNGPKFRVLYAGNIGRAHPIQTIMGAAESLNQDNPEVEFVFVGDGPRHDQIARERSRRGLDNIRLLPYQPDNRLRELMESGDLHLVSMNDNAAGALVPCKLYSALAVSRPCVFIGPEQSEAAKVIHDFGAGTVVPQGDAQSLAGTIRMYLQDSEAWFSAHHGAAKAGNIFVPDDAINAWIERAWSVVQSDLTRGSRPRARRK